MSGLEYLIGGNGVCVVNLHLCRSAVTPKKGVVGNYGFGELPASLRPVFHQPDIG
jgi:hypothetical protein